MPGLRIILEGDGCWPDLADWARPHQESPRLQRTEDIEIACLVRGMQSGSPSVALRVNCPDGSVVLAETSLALLLTAADAFKARYGDPRTGGG
jgi:hypothetical protein